MKLFQDLLIMTNETNNDVPKKKKRGRPKKPKPKLPEFKSDRDIREYILNTGLQLALELKEQALKKNNIKKAHHIIKKLKKKNQKRT